MAPLTSMTGTFAKDKVQKFIRSNEMQKAFDQTKALIATDTLAAYPDIISLLYYTPTHLTTN